jgi:hypothetical protein
MPARSFCLSIVYFLRSSSRQPRICSRFSRVQWRLYGHPIASGHGTFAEMFSIPNVFPNVRECAMRGSRARRRRCCWSGRAWWCRSRGSNKRDPPCSCRAPIASSVCLAALMAMPVWRVPSPTARSPCGSMLRDTVGGPVPRCGSSERRGDRHVTAQRQRELLHGPSRRSMGLAPHRIRRGARRSCAA